jgi:hypothetical protein
MPAYLLLHPAAGILAVGLILLAYWMKVGRPRFWRLHYWTGASAGLAGAAALGLAIWTVVRRSLDSAGTPGMPAIALAHLGLAALGIMLLALQVGLGLAMRLVIGGPPRFYRYHRLNARLLAGTAAVVLVFGAATLVMSLRPGA